MSNQRPSPPSRGAPSRHARVTSSNTVAGPRGKTFTAVQRSPLRQRAPAPRAPAPKPKAGLTGKSPAKSFRPFPRSTSAIEVLGNKHSTNSTPVTNLGKQMQGVLNVSSPIGKGKSRAFSANGFTRVPSLEKNQHQQLHGGSFRRMPAHLVALDASRRAANKPVPQPLFKDKHGKEKIQKAKAHCQSLKQHVMAVTSQVDFTAMDKIAVSKGEESLRSLRQQLEQVDYLCNCFVQMVSGRDHRQNPAAKGTNSILIKSYVVSSQAAINKIPEEMDVETAEQVIQVVDQGLLEQVLSWVGEIEISLEAVRLFFKAAMPVSQPQKPLAPSQRSRPEQPAVRRKFISGPTKRNRSCENESPQSSPDLAGTSERRPAKKDRMQRMRPPPLVVPESSYERR